MTTAPARSASRREDADERLVVVTDVRPLGRGHPLRDPPQPEEPDDVVDPDAAGVAQDGPHHVAERCVPQRGEPVRAPRWLAPVLAELVELVRRRSDGHTRGERVAQPPGVGALGMDADRKVVDDPDRHAHIRADRRTSPS